jgi:hypothetical protein
MALNYDVRSLICLNRDGSILIIGPARAAGAFAVAYLAIP